MSSIADATLTASVVAVRRDGTPVTQRLPARRYSWAPFQFGNRAAVRHGAFCKAIISKKANELRTALVWECPWLLDGDIQALELLCWVEARARLLHLHVMRVAAEQGVEAVPRYLWGEARRADLRAMKLTDSLGLSPMGRARLRR